MFETSSTFHMPALLRISSIGDIKASKDGDVILKRVAFYGYQNSSDRGVGGEVKIQQKPETRINSINLQGFTSH